MRAVTVLMMREAPIWVEVLLQGVNEIVAGELLFLRERRTTARKGLPVVLDVVSAGLDDAENKYS